MQRRNFLSALFAGLTIPLFWNKANAMQSVSLQDSGAASIIPSGLWDTLADAVAGTDPSTSTTALPVMSKRLLALQGKTVELQGYIQPSSGRFAKPEYIISRLPYHCNFCYSGGRASLALAQSAKPLPHTMDQLVTIRGTMNLQKTDPADFYFQLRDAVIV